MNQIIEFRGFKCTLEKTQYENKRVALMLNDAEDGQKVTTCTVNLPEQECKEDEVFIKTYSENYGLLNILVEEGIVAPPHNFINSGFVVLPVCKLLV